MEYSAVNAAGGKKRAHVKSFKTTPPRVISGALGLEDGDKISWDLKYDEEGPYAIVRKAKKDEKQEGEA